MKTRFNTYDIVCGVAEIQRLVGQRVNQIYDIDSKTYLIRLQGGERKTMLLIESGIRFHVTAFEWPKNLAPSGLAMKLRKHLKNKRLENVKQLGADRIIDFQFGVGEAAYHIILELYDRGNIILTDHELTILYILRPHCEDDEVRFAIREKYPIDRAKNQVELPNEEDLRKLLHSAAPGENLKQFLMRLLSCGPTVIDHVLTKYKLESCIINSYTEVGGVDENVCTGKEKNKTRKQKLKEFGATSTRQMNIDTDIKTLMQAIQESNEILVQGQISISKGFIIQMQEEKPNKEGDATEYFYKNIEYHPYLFAQFKGQPMAIFDSFMLAVDEFYSTLEGQKIDLKTLQQERDALKKLSNVKKDHAMRLEGLTKAQKGDRQKAELITCNQTLVDNAILAVRSAIANQMPWPDIHELVKAAQANADPVASAIKQLKLEVNHISIQLSDPYWSAKSDEDNDEGSVSPLIVDVDLALSAWANARKYYDQKRSAAQKEQKTIDASQKALKSAERKTQQTLKDVRTISTISKARKVYWFEKFYWFISSENYLVIGGRDAQQNELIVKRYMRSSDIYVHAEIQGASSVVIRNPAGGEVPPKTLLEAGTMAISYSVAWDAKVVTNAYWVHSDQVSKTAPTGEYLGTGSFMVRGKKNFLPSCHLIMGLSLLFKLEDGFVEKHRGERKVRAYEEEKEEKFEKVEQRLKYLKDTNEDDTTYREIVNEFDDKLNIISENETKDTKTTELDDAEEETSNFPDTQVKIEHDAGCVIVHAESVSKIESDVELTVSKSSPDLEDATIIPAAPSRKKQQKNAKKRKEEQKRQTQKDLQIHKQTTIENSNKDSSQVKRGQKGKLRKIKSKYKDQDEEERELRMHILKSSGKEKVINSDCKLDQAAPSPVVDKTKQQYQPKAQSQMDVDDGEDQAVGADVEMLDALTGQPFDEDELLFAIPVVAPYQALQHYKFKVKLTPGTGKRGRAAKTALTMFSKDKNCGVREKDLLKSIKEEAMARNIPGKVKISAPQLQKIRK